ncbi:class I adenylate-forming enzyme family protein [Nocardia sp. NPDC059091]|uniref:class I adenylate-forming enzyme family protein n=1 Tax=Nocardia sp. NPDC059091 TaxID=3346724 RepID=UPI00369D2189
MFSSDPVTFDHRWRRAVQLFPNAVFLVFKADDDTVTQWTYAEFDEIVGRLAANLVTLGCTPGSSIHIALRNCPAFVGLWLAAARVGAWIVPVDPASSSRDIESQIRRTNPAVGFCAADRADIYRRGAASVPHVLALAETAQDLELDGVLTSAIDWRVVELEPAPSPTTRLAVMFTSGTTSEPKGVVLSQHNYAHVADTMSSIIDLTSHHRWLVTLPLFHANAQYYCFAPAIAVGASVALTARFSASQWPFWAQELNATHASLFAAPIRMILARRRPDAPALELEHVWFAQSLAPAHYAEFAGLAGCVPRQLYGMTETVAIVTAELGDNPRCDAIGRPADAGRTTAVVDLESGSPAPTGTPGMLLVAGVPGQDLFCEYLDDPATTAAALVDDGNTTWLRTSDLVSSDSEGGLRFVGRADDVIKVAGENVSLTEIEATLAQAPGVLEAAVLARPDPIRDVVPIAFVVANSHTPLLSEAGLAEWAEKNLPPQSRPRAWHFVPELPRTSVGKIRRHQLQAFADSDIGHGRPITVSENKD